MVSLRFRSGPAEQAGNGGCFAFAAASGISFVNHLGGRPGGTSVAAILFPRTLIVFSSPAPAASQVIQRTARDSGQSQCGSRSGRSSEQFMVPLALRKQKSMPWMPSGSRQAVTSIPSVLAM